VVILDQLEQEINFVKIIYVTLIHLIKELKEQLVSSTGMEFK
jgi:hypothetical protein